MKSGSLYFAKFDPVSQQLIDHSDFSDEERKRIKSWYAQKQYLPGEFYELSVSSSLWYGDTLEYEWPEAMLILSVSRNDCENPVTSRVIKDHDDLTSGPCGKLEMDITVIKNSFIK